MRCDMAKVLVERGSVGGSDRRNGRPPRDIEDLPSREGIRRPHRHRKELDENLSPLRRFIRSRVGRHWDKVYSEIRERVRFENTVQQHILVHLSDYVAVETRLVDGRITVMGPGRRGGPEPVANSDFEFFVHPVSRMLLVNRHYRSRSALIRQSLRRQPTYRRVLSPEVQLQKINGCWFEIQLAVWPNGGLSVRYRRPEHPYDAIIDAGLSRLGRRELYGRGDVYARSKRQLGRRELKWHSIEND